MAIRQTDERFIVNTVVPALEKAERMARLTDQLESLRSGETVEGALTLQIRSALDEVVLRIKTQGSFGWKAVNKRLPQIQSERCQHASSQPTWVFDNGLPAMKGTRCSRCWLVLSTEEQPQEAAAS